MRVSGRAASLLAAALVAVTVTGCVSPAINDQGYTGKVWHAAESMTGIVVTARHAVALDLQGRSFGPFTDTVVSDAESDAQSVLSALDVVQPPTPAMTELRSKADDVLQAAAGHVSDLRIAVRHGDRSGEQKLLSALAEDLKQLTALQDNA